ncbi:Protein of unknown function [Pyronema omphalodes CBS 100304]|uniref:Uncharacterized protein n=1 Tax=Pyronema omphalodes (strain CBS 100304) TaxID=1076935 RepID=U4L4S4_PYROM|nr:Protein of unknown function [Pyronema omphalodes CBS 100304]
MTYPEFLILATSELILPYTEARPGIRREDGGLNGRKEDKLKEGGLDGRIRRENRQEEGGFIERIGWEDWFYHSIM